MKLMVQGSGKQIWMPFGAGFECDGLCVVCVSLYGHFGAAWLMAGAVWLMAELLDSWSELPGS